MPVRQLIFENSTSALRSWLRASLPTDEAGFWERSVLDALLAPRRSQILQRRIATLDAMDLPTLVDIAVSQVNFPTLSREEKEPQRLKRLLIELKHLRHRYAHETSLPAEDQIRDADTILRVLLAINASESDISAARRAYNSLIASYPGSGSSLDDHVPTTVQSGDEGAATEEKALRRFYYEPVVITEPVARRQIPFDDEQRTAIDYPERNLLIQATAGSGKTEVLCARAARLIGKYGLSRVLVLTFSRRAAQEIRTRIGESVPGLNAGTRQAWVGTFHAMCWRILRQFGGELGLCPDWSVLSAAIAKKRFRELDYSLYCNARNRLATWAIGEDVLSEAAQVSYLAEEDHSKKTYLSRDDWWASVQTDRDAWAKYPPWKYFKESIAAYKRECKADNKIDFDDLLLFSLRLLTESAAVRGLLQDRFKVIMVDEYQDTSPLQAELLRALAGKSNSITVIGDDAQCIYSFRGADPENLGRFVADFDASTVQLTRNYRSSRPIQLAAEGLRMRILDRPALRANLRSQSSRLDGHTPRILVLANTKDEVDLIAHEVAGLMSDYRPKSRPSIGILTRTHATATDILNALNRLGIPAKRLGEVSFFDLPHVSCLLSLLRLLKSAEDEQEIRNVRNVLHDGSTIQFPWNSAHLIIETVTESVDEGFWRIFDSLLSAQVELESEGMSPDAVEKRRQMLRALANMVLKSDLPAFDEQVSVLVPVVSYLFHEHCKAESSTVLADLAELETLAKQYDSLSSFAGASLEREPQAEEEERVIISTVHAAKGAQWDHVYIVRAVEGEFPSKFASREVELEEERRLFYVAMTRARKSLTITTSESIVEIRTSENAKIWRRLDRSRFLAELSSYSIDTFRVQAT